MQIHFKTKEDAIAYLEQRNAGIEERLFITDRYKQVANNALAQKLKEIENSSWWIKFWYPDTKYDYSLESDTVSRLLDEISALSKQLQKNDEHIRSIMEAENAEGFTIEV